MQHVEVDGLAGSDSNYALLLLLIIITTVVIVRFMAWPRMEASGALELSM